MLHFNNITCNIIISRLGKQKCRLLADGWKDATKLWQ